MSPETLESLRAADVIMEEFRVTSRKRIEESNEIIRRETQRMADIREQGRLFDIQFAEDMKKYEDVFKFNFKPRRFTGTQIQFTYVM